MEQLDGHYPESCGCDNGSYHLVGWEWVEDLGADTEQILFYEGVE